MDNVFNKRMEAGLMEDSEESVLQEEKGLGEKERLELNKLLNLKIEEPKKKESKSYVSKIKNLLLSIADLL